ncbi:hypothetical protein HK098_008360 [Nowakowskiella sp. JEL0407]|nr:hypothetical protein HK098_008360 [Nowakowskiella sp. JEL0407]
MQNLIVFLSISLLSYSVNAQTATAAVKPSTTGAASTFTKWCATGNTVCVAAIPLPAANPTSVQFTMWSTKYSWIGFGVGSGMSDADCYIGWNSLAGNKMIVSDRTCSGYALPASDAAQQIQIGTSIPAALTGTIPAGTKTAVTFTRQLNANAPNKPIAKGSVNYIIAMGSTRPATDVSTSSFSKHDEYTTFSFDFLNLAAGSTASGSATGGPIFVVANKNLIHGIMMTIAWTVCPMTGIFVARYLKDVMGKWWYYTHVGLLLGGSVLLSTAGIVFIVLTSSPPHFSLSNPHKPIGLAIGIDAVLQAVLGFICNHMWSPDRTSVPWWDKVHWWNGRLLTILALVNVYLGLRLMTADPPFIIAFFVFVGVGVAALIAGQFFFGQVHHVKKDSEFGDFGGKNDTLQIGRPYDSFSPTYGKDGGNGGYNGGYNGGGYNRGGYN